MLLCVLFATHEFISTAATGGLLKSVGLMVAWKSCSRMFSNWGFIGYSSLRNAALANSRVRFPDDSCWGKISCNIIC
jgi:hypothetical protein